MRLRRICRTTVIRCVQSLAGDSIEALTMPLTSMSIINMRRELSVRFESATRQWLAARAAYRRLHDSHVKDLFALRDAAQRLDQVERGRNALLRDLKALSD